jgi:hypothetical protein
MNPIIEVDGNRATGNWLLLEPCTFVQGNQPAWGAGRYEEQYLKVGGEWKTPNGPKGLEFWEMIILAHDRRRIHSHGRHRACHRRLALASANRSLPVGHCSALSATRSRCLVWPELPQASRRYGDHGSHHGTMLTLAECIRRTRDRFDSPGVFRPHRDLQRAPSAPRPLLVCASALLISSRGWRGGAEWTTSARTARMLRAGELRRS